jgi:hypothetical protein
VSSRVQSDRRRANRMSATTTSVLRSVLMMS